MLWSINSCQNRVSADQYHPTVSWAQVLAYRGRVFLDFIRWQVTSFQMIAGLSLMFFNSYEIFCVNLPNLIWPRTRNSGSYYRQGRQLLSTFPTMVTSWSRSTSNFYALIVQNLRGELMRKTYAASWNLFTLTAEADSVLSQLVIFLTVFFYWMYKIHLLSRVFCYSWLVCLLGFWLRNTSLVKVGNPISDGIVFVFHLAWYVRGV